MTFHIILLLVWLLVSLYYFYASILDARLCYQQRLLTWIHPVETIIYAWSCALVVYLLQERIF